MGRFNIWLKVPMAGKDVGLLSSWWMGPSRFELTLSTKAKSEPVKTALIRAIARNANIIFAFVAFRAIIMHVIFNMLDPTTITGYRGLGEKRWTSGGRNRCRAGSWPIILGLRLKICWSSSKRWGTIV